MNGRSSRRRVLGALFVALVVTGAFVAPAIADQVILDDLIVDGSACVGVDCVDGETFGFDTVRLKENNTRLAFDDTSTDAGFANQDWLLRANDSGSGGLNRFSIDQVTTNGASEGIPLFTLEPGAGSNALYVDSTGRVGFGTSSPVLPLHSREGNTPGLRLDQDASSGFQSQVWDVAGNESNFFVRDVTNGSTLPFRIRPGAPTSSLDIAASGNVGLGTTSPDRNLHVRDASSPGIRLEDSGSGQEWDIESLDDLALTDATASTTPFRIRPGAPTSSLDIAASGNVGIGTNSPGKNLHVEDASNPGIRLRDSGSGQAWDIEAPDGLSVKDASANTTPVTVEPGAPNRALVVDGSGNLGVGTNNPGNPLTVDARNDSAGKEQVLQLLNNGPPGFELNNTTAGEAWRYAMDVKNRFVISRAGSGGASLLIGKQGEVFMGRPFKFFLRPNGNLEISGTLTENSDRAQKHGIDPVDAARVLAKLQGLPISTWSYDSAPGATHMGPMAQDFYEAFGLGSDPTDISPRDMAAVSMAAIQALEEERRAMRAEIEVLKSQLTERDRQVEDLETRLRRIEERLGE